MTVTSVTAVRSDDILRNQFLTELTTKNRSRIVAVLRSIVGERTSDLLDEATQAFMLTANRALDSAREQDDGRGKNDPARWCVYRGLHAVRDFARESIGRADVTPLKAQFKSSIVYAEDLEPVREDGRANPFAAIDPQDYADIAIAHISVQEFLDTLEPRERDVTLLLMYGENETTHLTCVCPYGSSKHSVVRDIAAAIDMCEASVYNILRSVRAKAALAFGRAA